MEQGPSNKQGRPTKTKASLQNDFPVSKNINGTYILRTQEKITIDFPQVPGNRLSPKSLPKKKKSPVVKKTSAATTSLKKNTSVSQNRNILENNNGMYFLTIQQKIINYFSENPDDRISQKAKQQRIVKGAISKPKDRKMTTNPDKFSALKYLLDSEGFNGKYNLTT